MPVKYFYVCNISICYFIKIINNMNMDENTEKILQNLQDANCSAALISKYFALAKAGNTFEQLKLLASHKTELLNSLHKCQKQIDCLDFLIFNLEQQAKAR